MIGCGLAPRRGRNTNPGGFSVFRSVIINVQKLYKLQTDMKSKELEIPIVRTFGRTWVKRGYNPLLDSNDGREITPVRVKPQCFRNTPNGEEFGYDVFCEANGNCALVDLVRQYYHPKTVEVGDVLLFTLAYRATSAWRIMSVNEDNVVVLRPLSVRTDADGDAAVKLASLNYEAPEGKLTPVGLKNEAAYKQLNIANGGSFCFYNGDNAFDYLAGVNYLYSKASGDIRWEYEVEEA